MKISEMIEVLQAAESGKVVESKLKTLDQWEVADTPVWDFHYKDYRIAQKKELSLVEELRAVDPDSWYATTCKHAADRIESLEIANQSLNLYHRTTDELLAEIKRRLNENS